MIISVILLFILIIYIYSLWHCDSRSKRLIFLKASLSTDEYFAIAGFLQLTQLSLCEYSFEVLSMNLKNLTNCELRNFVPVFTPTCWNKIHQCSFLMKILFYMFVYSRNNLNDLFCIKYATSLYSEGYAVLMCICIIISTGGYMIVEYIFEPLLFDYHTL